LLQHCIKSKITEIWLGIIKPISRQTPLNLKTNLVHISSNELITKMIIKWTVTTVPSKNTGSTIIGIIRSSRSSEKLESIQFAQA